MHLARGDQAAAAEIVQQLAQTEVASVAVGVAELAVRLGDLETAQRVLARHEPAQLADDLVRLAVAYQLEGSSQTAGWFADQAARAGDHRGEYNLGKLCRDAGELDEAERWYRRAAEAGYPDAQHNLGALLFQQGRLAEAEDWLRRVADTGDHDAQNGLGVLLVALGRAEEAEGWYRRAADAGNPLAAANLRRLAAEG